MLRPAPDVFWRREDTAILLVGPGGAIRLSGSAVETWDTLVALNSRRTSSRAKFAVQPESDEVRQLAKALVAYGYLEDGDGAESWETTQLGHLPTRK